MTYKYIVVNAKLIPIIAFLFILCNASLASLQITPTSFSISQKVNELGNYTVIVKNTANFTFYNISFQSLQYFTFPTILQLNPNEEHFVNLTLISASPVTLSSSTKVQGYYNVTVILSPKNHNMTINDTKFSPQVITINKDDSIIFFNNGTITHQVLGANIAPNNSYTHQFTTTGNTTLQDGVNPLIQAQVVILPNSAEQLAHNDNYDATLSFSGSISLSETTISIEAIGNTFFAHLNSSTDGLLKLTNTGSKEASSIILSADKWISFSQNSFNLAPSANKVVSYTISPSVSRTNETEKNYTIIIRASSSNAEQATASINVFIPYAFLGFSNESGINPFDELRIFCEKNPDSVFCKTQPTQIPVETIVYRDAPIQYNFTQAELSSLITSSARTSEDVERGFSVANQRIDTMANDLAQLKKENTETKFFFNETNELLKQQEKGKKNSQLIFWIIFAIVAVNGLFFTVFKILKRGKEIDIVEKVMGHKEDDD